MNPRHLAVEENLRRSGMSCQELWREYFALGGRASPFELEAFLHGAMEFDRLEYDIAALALNEYFMVRGENHPVPYFIDL